MLFYGFLAFQSGGRKADPQERAAGLPPAGIIMKGGRPGGSGGWAALEVPRARRMVKLTESAPAGRCGDWGRAPRRLHPKIITERKRAEPPHGAHTVQLPRDPRHGARTTGRADRREARAICARHEGGCPPWRAHCANARHVIVSTFGHSHFRFFF